MESVMTRLTYGLFVLSVHCYKKDNACIINTAVQVASSPERISISVNKANHTAQMLEYAEEFALSVISEDADFSLFQRFGFQSGKEIEKFDGFDGYRRLPDGTCIVTRGTNAYLSAHIEERIDLGSHWLIIASPRETGILSSVPSASYGYYHTNIKPKPVEKKPEEGTLWRCKVCGYEYRGEELAEDFICPVCKHPASDFEKV